MKSVKKFIGLLMTMVMVISMILPISSSTVYAADRIESEGIVTSKTAVLQDDGTYKITLEAYATGEEVRTTTTEAKASDIVLVLDVSGSMKDLITVGKTNSSGRDMLDTEAEEGWYQFTLGSTNYPMRYDASTGKWQYMPQLLGGITGWTNIGEGFLGSLVGWSGRDVKISKLNALKLSSKKFVNAIAADAAESGAEHNISVVKFADDSYANSNHLVEGDHMNGSSNRTELVKNFKPAQTSASEILNAVFGLQYGGATAADYGMTIAKEVLNQSAYKNDGKNKVVVMFTDGEPNHGSGFTASVANNTIKDAKDMKDDKVTVYSVGLYSDNPSTNMTNYMNAVSSNHPYATGYSNSARGEKVSSNYYLTANTAEGLDDIFGTIATDTITGGSSVTADSTTVVKDVMSDTFVIPASGTVTTYTVDVNNSASKSAGAVTFASTKTPVNLNVVKGEKEVTVDGFDFAANWCGKDGSNNYRGKKLVIEITGVTPQEGAFTGEAVNTNGDGSGVFAADKIHEIEEFEKPAVTLNEKAVVIDYAKPVQIETGVRKFLVNNALTTAAPAMTFGSLALNGGTLTYAPTTTSWTGEDVVYTFGTDWTKTAIKPATNVYYEDTFQGTAGANASITYTGSWSKGTAGDNAGSTTADGVDGWVEAIATENGYTDGSNTSVNVENGTASATIYFTGTGIDVYTKTTATSGLVMAVLTPAESGTGIKSKMLKVYNESKSGDYYSVPTLSFNNLEYANYKLVISVTKDASTKENGQYDYSIDGIRIYNPSRENTAVFTNINTLIDASSSVFVDETGNVTSVNSAKESGTNLGMGDLAQNEVYLSQGATVSFRVSGGDKYLMGMKSLTGAPVTAEFTKGSMVKSVATISHTGDLYYEVVPEGGIITVKNAGSNVLALTKLQTITSDAAAVSVASVEGEEAVVASARFASFAPMAYSLDPVAEEAISQPEEEVQAPVVDITEPEETVQPEAPAQNQNIVNKLFSGLKKLFGR